MVRYVFIVVLCLLIGTPVFAKGLPAKYGGSFVYEKNEPLVIWYVKHDKKTRVKIEFLKDLQFIGTNIPKESLASLPFADYGLDASGFDSDSDGISDWIETIFKSDLDGGDSDSDGYGDKEELVNGYSLLGKEKINYNKKDIKKRLGKVYFVLGIPDIFFYLHPVSQKIHTIGVKNFDKFSRDLSLSITKKNLNSLKETKIVVPPKPEPLKQKEVAKNQEVNGAQKNKKPIPNEKEKKILNEKSYKLSNTHTGKAYIEFSRSISVPLNENQKKIFLSWNSGYVDECVASGAWNGKKTIGYGVEEFPLSAIGVYVLECWDAAKINIARSEIEITKEDVEAEISFEVVPKKIKFGEKAELRWKAVHFTECRSSVDKTWKSTVGGSMKTDNEAWDSGNRGLQGTFPVIGIPMGKIRFWLWCENPLRGYAAEAETTLEINDITIASFEYIGMKESDGYIRHTNTIDISPGEKVSFAWKAKDAKNCVFSTSELNNKNSFSKDVATTGVETITPMSSVKASVSCETDGPPTPALFYEILFRVSENKQQVLNVLASKKTCGTMTERSNSSLGKRKEGLDSENCFTKAYQECTPATYTSTLYIDSTSPYTLSSREYEIFEKIGNLCVVNVKILDKELPGDYLIDKKKINQQMICSIEHAQYTDIQHLDSDLTFKGKCQGPLYDLLKQEHKWL